MRKYFIITAILLALMPFNKAASFEIMKADSIKDQVEEKLVQESDGQKFQIVDFRITREGAKRLLRPDNPIFKESLSLIDFRNSPEEKSFDAIFIAEVSGERIQASGKYNSLIEIPVLAARKARGEIIDDADIKLISLSERLVRKDTIRMEEQLIGKELTRSVYAERPISSKDLTTPKLVAKGNMVPLVYRTQYMELKTSGNALDDGAFGDIIRVKNPKSGAIVQARVEENGELMVNYLDHETLFQVSEATSNNNLRN